MSRLYRWLCVCMFVVVPFSLTYAQQESGMKSTVVVFETNQGNIELTLFADKAPKTVENFVGLVKKGYYNNLIFHRVIKNFMIQGGDPTGTGRGGSSLWGGTFADEINPSLVFDAPGILAMANSGPDTNGSQFFITTVPTPWLNGHHTIFGKVTTGYDIVQKIENTPTGSGDRPVEDQKILKAYVKE
jgi:peptidylprolyl isomerase